MTTYIRGILAVAMLIDASGSVRVTSTNGRIVLEDATGKTSPLTATGRDSEPWLSPDQTTVVFVRAAPGDTFHTSVYEINLLSRTERLLFKGPLDYQGQGNTYLGRPELDATSRTLFLLTKGSMRTGELFAVNLASGKARPVTDAAGYDVIQCGSHRGDLLVYKWEQGVLGAPFYLYWFFSPEGREIGVAAPDGADVAPLLDPACKEVNALEVEEEKLSEEMADRNRHSKSVPPQISADVMARRLKVRVEPEYPVNAKSQGIGGTVRLQLLVAPDGSVDSVKLISGPPELVASAIAAVRQWRYAPMISNGSAIGVATIVELHFASSK